MSFIWFILLLACQSPSSARIPESRNECDASFGYTWNEKTGSCYSAKPCALERDSYRCGLNTWGCTYQGGSCSKLMKRKESIPRRCPALASQDDCESENTCIWFKNKCDRKPTIVLSLADDLGWYDVGWRNPRARTPVLDRMRDWGVGVERHYVSRFCAPTRAMILTGRHPWKMGLQTDLNMNPAASLRCASGRETALIPQVLKDSGSYKTHGFGKWHLGQHNDNVIPTGRGFDTFIGYYGGGILNHKAPKQFWSNRCACPSRGGKGTCNQYKRGLDLVCTFRNGMVNTTAGGYHGFVAPEHIQEEVTDLFLAKQAEKTILQANDEDPLFLFLSWSTPHSPIVASQQYKDAILKSRKPFGSDAPLLKYKKCSIKRRLTHLAMVSTMDDAHRIVIDALETVNRFDTTVFVFLSDNGANGPAHKSPKELRFCGTGYNYPLRGNKYSWWEGAIRSHAFVYSRQYVHETRRDTKFNSLIGGVDWRRTLLRASGSNANLTDDDGIDFWHALSSQGTHKSTPRLEMPLQVWPEQNRYVLLFVHDKWLWKIIRGYPYSGTGPGNVGIPTPEFSNSAILQPLELPRDEMVHPTHDGFGSAWECQKDCLFNVALDPQELSHRTQWEKRAHWEGIQKLWKLKEQGVLLKDSGFCDKGWYATDNMDTTDRYSIDYARSCGGFAPWLDSGGNRKPLCA